jgi:glycosyltransferase involved in cell wall biosynthesis
MEQDSTPLVSLVLTTYQRPEMAKRAVESMISQTYENTEVIVVEDAGDTSIREWIKENHDEITFIRNDHNQGLAAARNIAIDVSSGKCIAFLDDDDEWYPTKTEKQVQEAERLLPEHNLGVVYCGVEDYFEFESRKQIRLPKNEGRLRKEIMTKGARTLSSSHLFLREALLEVGGFDESLPSSIDHDIWMKLAVGGYEVGTVKEPLVIKRHSDDREEITSDPNARIEGVRKYTKKWRPTYKKWFGSHEGNKHVNKYFADVVGRLTVRKAFTLELGDCANGVVALFTHNPRNPYNLYYLAKHGVVVGGSRLLPKPIKRMIKKSFGAIILFITV